jgi:aryl-alcohol dehydrogenase-like predicted oxidoreductase
MVRHAAARFKRRSAYFHPPQIARRYHDADNSRSGPNVDGVEYRRLGSSGLFVPALSFGTGTFGGKGAFFSTWGNTDVADARRMVDICLDAGLTLFDSADGYSEGAAESILGEALAGRRDRALISTKIAFRRSDDPNDVGSSRAHLVPSVDAALKRLKSDTIDLLQLHAFDAFAPPEEVLSTLDALVRSGKVRYIGVSNYSGWHLMKSLAVSERYGYPRYVAHQAYYSLLSREFEWELMPLGLDQGVGTLVWSPLGWGRLTGKLERGKPAPAGTRLGNLIGGPVVPDELLWRVIDALTRIANDTGHTVPQVAINWLLRRPGVASVIVGARNEEQLVSNLGAIGWELAPEQLAALDAASTQPAAYPYWHQREYPERNPPPV